MAPDPTRLVKELSLDVSFYLPERKLIGGLTEVDAVSRLQQQTRQNLFITLEGIDLIAGRYAAHVEEMSLTQDYIGVSSASLGRVGRKDGWNEMLQSVELKIQAHDLADRKPGEAGASVESIAAKDLEEITENVFALVPESLQANAYVRQLVTSAARAAAKKGFEKGAGDSVHG